MTTRRGSPASPGSGRARAAGYGKQDAASHGSPWPMNSAEFWATLSPVHGAVRGRVQGRRRPGARGCGGAAGTGRGQPARRPGCPAPGRRPGRVAVRPPPGSRRERAGSDRRPPPGRQDRGGLHRPEALRRPGLPGRHVEAAGGAGAQPRRPGCLGSARQRGRPARLRASAVHRRLRRPGRVHQHRRLRPGLR